MPKLKAPLLSLAARGGLSSLLSFAKRRGRHIVERKPIPTDAKSPNQLFYRHMFTKCADLWHTLSEAEQQEWESLARPRHMTGYAWFISQCLRPNPGIYLPLQGGTMQGIISMDGFAIEDLLDPVAVQDADTKAARDAAIAAALEDCIDSHIHGWDGANWQKLLVESATHHNLRVRLYCGPYEVTSDLWSNFTANPANQSGLDVRALMYAYRSDTEVKTLRMVSAIGDNQDGLNTLAVGLSGYTGSKWWRLRSWATGILKVGRAEIDSTTVRKVAAGAVVAGSRELYWVACSPDAPGAEWELSDAIAGGGAVVYDHFDPDKHSNQLVFDPPLKFSNGIWIEKFDHMHSLIFCYV